MKRVFIMKRVYFSIIPVISIISFLMTGCVANKEYIKKQVAAEVKSELKDVNDFLNVAYSYKDPKALENLFNMDKGLKAMKYDITCLKKKISNSRSNDPGSVDFEKINREIASKLAKIDEEFEVRFTKIGNDVEIQLSKIDESIHTQIDGKLIKVYENIEENKLDIKEYKFDIKSNKIDMKSNRTNIRAGMQDIKENRLSIKENKQEVSGNNLELAEKINSQQNDINKIKFDISNLKDSSKKLLLTMNDAK